MNTVMKRALLVMSLGLLSLALFSCDVTDPLEDVHLLFNMVPMSTVVSVDFVDSYDSSLITSPVNMEVTGPGSNMVVNLENEATTSFTSGEGIICFGIKDEADVSIDNPLEINLVFSAAGYMLNSRALTLTSTNGQSFSVVMANSANLPDGVTVSSLKAATAINGVTSEEISISTTPSRISGAKVTITIPEGTTIRDRAGNKIAGDLKTTATYFDPSSDEALEVFPGGFVVNAANSKAMIPENGTFVTAGFAYFSTKNEKGEVAATFDKAVTVDMEIPAGTWNPETNAAIKAGDSVPVYSYAPDDGTWDLEDTGTAVGPNGDGNFTVQFSTKHFSYWNLDWFEGDACYEGIAVHVTGEFNSVTLSVHRVDNGQLVYSGIYVTADDPIVNLINVPGNLPVAITAYSADGCYNQGAPVGNVVATDLCGEDVELAVEIPTVDPMGVGTTTVSFTVSAWCEDEPDVRMRPSLMIYMMGNCSWYFAGYMENGELSIPNLTLGTEYTFGVWFDGNIYPFDFLIDRDTYEYEFVLPASICAMFSI
jgi:hypothetical protein